MTKIKDALAKWEEKNAMSAVSSKEIKLCGLIPPIEKMDATLGQLIHCEKLSLSTNNIDKIANLGNLKNLKVHALPLLSYAPDRLYTLTTLPPVLGST